MSRSRRQLAVFSIFFLTACAATAMAGPAGDEARALIEQVGGQTIEAVKLEDKVARRLKLTAVGALVLDYRAIARSVLAQSDAKVSSEREIEVIEGVILFISNQIITRLESLRADKIEIVKVDEITPDKVLVVMALSGPQGSIVTEWTVIQTANGWHVSDLSAAGVSISQHFGQILRPHAGTMDRLMQYLRDNSPLNSRPPSEQARRLIQQVGERTIAAIKLEDKAERRLQLIADGALVMNYRVMAKSVLGWAGAKLMKEREIELTEAVILYVSHQIINAVEKVRPDKAEITKVDEKNPNTVLISMDLSGPQDSIAAIWTVTQTPNGWLVSDLSASGFSLSQHFGQQLASHARSMDQLAQYLKEHSPLKRENLTQAR